MAFLRLRRKNGGKAAPLRIKDTDIGRIVAKPITCSGNSARRRPRVEPN
jgi:hypothetical protein